MLSNHTHFAIDFNTLGVSFNSALASVAVVPFVIGDDKSFDDYVQAGETFYFDVEHQVRSYNRKVLKSTINYWVDKNPDFKTAKKNQLLTFEFFIDSFETFLKEHKYSRESSLLFSWGSHFDFPLLESIYNDFKMPMGYNAIRVRDFKSVFDLIAGGTNGQYRSPTTEVDHYNHYYTIHNASLNILKYNEIMKNFTD